MIDILVIYGGQSGEHEISLKSAQTVINQLDKNKYRVSMAYIDKDGKFIENGFYKNSIEDPQDLKKSTDLNLLESFISFTKFVKELENPIVFPCIHGTTGEDGQIQGFLDSLHLRYVGNRRLSSAICMDKATTNTIFKAYNIPQAKYYILEKKKYIKEEDKKKLVAKIFDVCGENVVVKPSGNGSSLGVNKAKRENILEAIEEAFKYDSKVLIEEEIKGVELEVSVLGNLNPKASLAGSYTSSKDLFDYEAKYFDKTTKENVPHPLDETREKMVRELAIDSYIAAGCSGLARVDIFMDRNGNFFVNEINTMPGMTLTSLYAKLWTATDGTSYPQLLDKLIELAIENFEG